MTQQTQPLFPLTPDAEKQLSYPACVDVSMVSASGTLYPGAWQQLVILALQKHLENIQMDVPRLIQRWGVSWVLLSLHLEIRRPAHMGQTVTVTTWNAGGTPPVYRREFSVQDTAGQVLAVGTSFSAVMELKSRRICTNREILSYFNLPAGEQLLAADSRFRETVPFADAAQRTAYPSWADAVGHVNNSRYQEMAYDALSPAERQNLTELKRMDIWFTGELLPGDTVTVQKARQDTRLFLKGVRQQDGKPSFIIEYTLTGEKAAQ